ncbi:hypothetical protein AMTR_s00166p00068220 [Amborella trichopoda]|uniref:Uncharacterized protein n=1 Tax=Amborella trichopoda TaxID=13333 RepID=W1PKK3_AMBTC|nr:hypothetical protein AMTR_s00166p00068220 [Amborella trichopoda]
MLKIQTHFSYQRLRNVGAEHEDKDRLGLIDYGFLRSRSFVRVRKLGSKRRLRLKIPSLKRFLRRRVRAVSGFRVSVAKAVKRLIEGRAHIGDLFAGNYMFMQVSPTPLSLYDKSLVPNRHALQYPPLQKVA